ncbi:MAG TPA: AAC(3) family N-acetyltransferase [Clostridiales bacterium]|nr:AAC(3) family N-acetyltransferase [Clostridiales bacterium]
MNSSKAECQKNISVSLNELGVKEGAIILVHSSLKSLGYVPGGPETVISGILDALGDKGTLLIPALSYKYVNADPDNPVFDVLNTPSNVGAFPEYFRERQGTIRSIHPTHSVCGTGFCADEILKDHILDTTPCGPNSPFRKLPEYGGKILFLGCGLRPNTSMHGVEELAEAPYLFKDTRVYRIIHPDEHVTFMTSKLHYFNDHKLEQRYDRVESMLDGDEIKSGKILDANAYLIDASALWKKALEIMRKDPYYFVEEI